MTGLIPDGDTGMLLQASVCLPFSHIVISEMDCKLEGTESD